MSRLGNYLGAQDKSEILQLRSAVDSALRLAELYQVI